MISTRPPKYKLEFCYPNTYTDFVNAVRYGKTLRRLCFVGIEHLRMFLYVERGIPAVQYFTWDNYSWVLCKKPPRERDLDVTRMAETMQGFEDELVETFFYAFPQAEEAFYDQLPTGKEVLAMLKAHPDISHVEELRLLYAKDSRCSVEDADGIITIQCDDGDLCVPYDESEGDVSLQMYRAKFHPDSKFVSLSDRFFDWCYRIWSKLSSLTWGEVLCGIDRIIK